MAGGHWSLKVGENDLVTLRPDLSAEWHPTKNIDCQPCDFQPRSKAIVWWLGRCGHEWDARICDRTAATSASAGCPFCCGKRVLIGFNDLLSTEPRMAEIWDSEMNNMGPDGVTFGSGKKCHWKCDEGHTWVDAPVQQLRYGATCPFCSDRRVWPGLNDFVTIHPAMAAEWHPSKNGDLDPRTLSRSSNVRAFWICKLGHEWACSINSRTKLGSSCPACCGQMLWVGFNDLSTTHPEMAAEWHPTKNGTLLPVDVLAGYNKSVWWMCAKGHEWRTSPNSRTQSAKQPSGQLKPRKVPRGSCSVCGGRTLLRGFNDFATLQPEQAAEWHPTKNGTLLPSDVRQWSSQRVWWLGKCGHEWQASMLGRSQNHGCPKCRSFVSKIEKKIFLELLKLDPSAVQGDVLPVNWTKHHNAVVDILLDNGRVVVEYDGSWWHRDKIERDRKKSVALLNAGYTVVRIRHTPLPSLAIAHPNYFEISHVRQSNAELAAEVVGATASLGVAA